MKDPKELMWKPSEGTKGHLLELIKRKNKRPSSLEQYVDSLMSKDYIHGVSSHSLIVSPVDRLKSRSRSRSKSPGHRLERPGLNDNVGRAQVASFDHRNPEPCRSGTIPCKFFASGNCRNGKACRFSHDQTRASFNNYEPNDCRQGADNRANMASLRQGSKWSGSASDLNLSKGHGNKNEGFDEQRAMRSSVDASALRDNRFKAHRMHIDEATKKNGSDDFRLTTHSSPGMSASKSRGTAIRGASFDHRKHEPCRSGTIPYKFFASGNCRNGKACRFSHVEQTRDISNNYEPNEYRQGVDNWTNMDPLREGSKWSGSASDRNLKKGHGNKHEGFGEQRAMRSSVDASALRDNRFMAHRMDIDEATKKNRSAEFRLTTHSSPGMSASKLRGTAIRGVDIEGTSSYTEDQLPTLIGTSGKPDVLDKVRSEATSSNQCLMSTEQSDLTHSQLPLTGEPSGDGSRGTRCKDVELNNNSHQSSEKHQFADCENEEHAIVKAEDKKEGQDGSKLSESEGDDKDDEKKKNSEGKSLRAFKFSFAESVKELLKPTWKAGQINKEAHKTIAKNVVDKVTLSVQASHIPQTQEEIDNYLLAHKPKLSKLVQAYVDKVQKENRKIQESTSCSSG